MMKFKKNKTIKLKVLDLIDKIVVVIAKIGILRYYKYAN